MNFGLAAEAEAVPTSDRSAAELTRLDKRRSRCDRNGAPPRPMSLSRRYECAFKGQRIAVVHAAPNSTALSSRLRLF
jgi:hypothetical protein